MGLPDLRESKTSAGSLEIIGNDFPSISLRFYPQQVFRAVNVVAGGVHFVDSVFKGRIAADRRDPARSAEEKAAQKPGLSRRGLVTKDEALWIRDAICYWRSRKLLAPAWHPINR
jgi:hypothetical protein